MCLLYDKRMIIVDDSFLYSYAQITLKELASRLNLSLRQTQRFLKKKYEKTFIEMRTDVRMDKAKEFMNNGMSPAEAATVVKYENICSLEKSGLKSE